jgi:hypothetical protein
MRCRRPLMVACHIQMDIRNFIISRCHYVISSYRGTITLLPSESDDALAKYNGNSRKSIVKQDAQDGRERVGGGDAKEQGAGKTSAFQTSHSTL